MHPFKQRRAGILLHPTSLPGRWGSGDLGDGAYGFIDFLASCDQSVWQMLPLGPTHHHGSPYQCLSVYAGNPQLISIDDLIQKGWLDEEEALLAFGSRDKDAVQIHYQLLAHAYRGFLEHGGAAEHAALDDFIGSQAQWLEDYALYQAIRKESHSMCWSQWPAALRNRDPAALEEARFRLHDFIHQVYFEQFVFSCQWKSLKAYAARHGVLLFGDMPIFVAYDSADVWAQRDYFALDGEGQPLVVAGVPPDYFSASGQLWGNPHYRWDLMEADGFRWWRDRITKKLELFDVIRIDHFRGFEAYWEVPADHPSAIHGRWVKAPGEKLFNTLLQYFETLPLVAEDLGLITPEVHALREKFQLPGMRVLQFAFDGSSDNPYLPHNHETNSVVYTGTHDNDTTLGWYESLPESRRRYVDDYLGSMSDQMPWPLIRWSLASVASMSIIPMQDLLMLGSDHRMNIPGTIENNWQWRFEWEQLEEEKIAFLRHLTRLYGRAVETE